MTSGQVSALALLLKEKNKVDKRLSKNMLL